MNKAPSRSEIESALKSKAQSKQRAKQSSDSDIGIPYSGRRARNIIGGDPSGVSKSIKRTNRLLVFGIIALVSIVAIAFMIPSPSKQDPQWDVVSNSQSENQFTNDSDGKPSFNDEFVRENDLDRAQEYRDEEEKERQISELLAKADAQLKNAKLSLPENDNAYATYQQILNVDERNRQARQGLKDIRQLFANNVVEAIELKDQDSALKNLSKLETIDITSEEYADSKQNYDEWRRATLLNSLNDKAQAALDKDDLILPSEGSALFYYRQMLTLESDEPRAQKGINELANIFVNKANEAISQGQYQAATGFLSTVGAIQPDNQSIDLIRKIIVNGEAIEKERLAQEKARQQSNTSVSQTQNQRQDSPPTTAASNVESRQIQDPANPSNPNVSALPTPNKTSEAKTPGNVASEQLLIDRQYLDRGLDAYYQGNYDSAKSLLQPLADKGISRAQVRLGYMHYFGRGFNKDAQEADRIIRAALPAVQKFADEGRAWAQADLGSLYEDGLVLPRNYSEAVAWYRLAAEQGYPGAQTNLGTMYALGRGVGRSRESAILWFQRAAKQGDLVAKNNLAALGVQ
jgi:TPR repeat protein